MNGRGWGIVSTTLMMSVVAVTVAVVSRHPDPHGTSPNEPPLWVAHIRAVDDALARGDIGAATRARHEAYVAALGSRRWEGLIEAGDAARRIARLDMVRRPSLASARGNYLAALFRARAAHSADGVLRACERFVELGDREPARQCLRIAQGLTARDATLDARLRIQALDDRLDSSSVVAVW